ncbi:MAG: NADH-ubiquinone oxidoreductase-F iron-sulfur binding region domain-containing protein [Acidimicrobiales bacterium]
METVSQAQRVLPEAAVADLAAHRSRGGGAAIDLAHRVGPEAVIAEIEAAGLRGRGGAGFPTGTKWRTVAENRSPSLPSTVVVNAAEGEPATFKDRTLVSRDPYSVIEGALVAAVAVGADTAVIATKEKFHRAVDRLQAAVDEIVAAGWSPDVSLEVVTGPDRYLFGEETALLEVIGGRPPFPRIAPPYREGSESAVAPASTRFAGPSTETKSPPTLVNNAETLANIGPILRHGADEFRLTGTGDTPGTLLVTVVGATARHGVAELPAGVTLREAIETIGEGSRPGRRITGAMSGVANPALFGDALDTELSHDAMSAVGSGLGAAGFTVFDDETDLVAVAHGVSRFLAVESCGQCEPCKVDGLAIAESLDSLRRSAGSPELLTVVDEKLHTVADSARCYLATQHEKTVRSLFSAAPEIFELHSKGEVPAADAFLVAPVTDISDGRASLDTGHLEVSADWTNTADSGSAPADRIDATRESG